MTTTRQSGQILPGDRVRILDRSRDLGRVATIDADTAQVAFDGIEGKTWTVPLAKLVRHWDVRRICNPSGRGPFRVEVRHPSYGFLTRGWISPVGVHGHSMVWSVQDYDHNQLPDVVGDYIVAERALLEATDELDEPAPADQLTA
jgi:hypothetical protein